MNQLFRLLIQDVGFEVRNDLHESELLSARVFDDLKPLVHNGKYRSYWTTAPHQIHGSSFYIRFYFENSELKSLHLHIATEDRSNNSIQDAAQLENAKWLNDRWLKDQFGINLRENGPWGSVESVLDPKSLSASIIFRFSEMAGV